MSEPQTLTTCPDCGVAPNVQHLEPCDVARCTTCGLQFIGCDCLIPSEGGTAEPTVWTGEWPGDLEVREGLAADLNDLIHKGVSGYLRWDGQRWQANGRPKP